MVLLLLQKSSTVTNFRADIVRCGSRSRNAKIIAKTNLFPDFIDDQLLFGIVLFDVRKKIVDCGCLSIAADAVYVNLVALRLGTYLR